MHTWKCREVYIHVCHAEKVTGSRNRKLGQNSILIAEPLLMEVYLVNHNGMEFLGNILEKII